MLRTDKMVLCDGKREWSFGPISSELHPFCVACPYTTKPDGAYAAGKYHTGRCPKGYNIEGVKFRELKNSRVP